MPPENNNSLGAITKERFDVLPRELQNAITDDKFTASLQRISSYFTLSAEEQELLRNEILFVLFAYEPVSKLGEALKRRIPRLSESEANAVVDMEHLSIFYCVTSVLSEIETNPEFTSLRSKFVTPVEAPLPDADSSLKEKLELRPQTSIPQPPVVDGGMVRPLTREEVLRSLAPARTMTQDIASLHQQNVPPAPPQP